jgi:serine protease AprX
MTGKLLVWGAAAGLGAAVVGGTGGPPAALGPATGSPGRQQVIVTGRPGQLGDVERHVTAAGGRIDRVLPLVWGVAAHLPADRIGEVRATPGVRSVTGDAVGHLMSVDPVLGYDLSGDDGSTLEIAQVTHAAQAWRQGATGIGVDVALIDSGVVPIPGLTSGNVINGPDLSFESTRPGLRYLDTYGHGTHMASIIAGRDVPLDTDQLALYERYSKRP